MIQMGILVFDSNGNGVYNDDWGSNGLDDDNDWGLYKDDLGNAYDVPHEPFIDLNGNGTFDYDVREGYADVFGTSGTFRFWFRWNSCS